ncbi:MAG TPA: TIGR00159 family protein [Thermoanaerobacterales bacterium]|nr:TIGR00159 family protein [Thermoanaerobacterales bacterium]
MLKQLLELIRQFRFRDLIDIAIVAYVSYKAIMLIKGTRAVQLIKGLVVLVISTKVSEWLGLYTINWLLRNTMTVGVIALLVVFQPELRRALEQLGRGRLFVTPFFSFSEEEVNKMINEMARAVQVLASNKIGALIVIERETGLNDVIETGLEIGGKLTTELLLNIFIPNTPLHDGAVLIRNDKIMAAGCFLPLTENPNLSKELGTRHRAALGITEQSDAVSIIVSEETGVISVAVEGKLTRYLDIMTFKEMIKSLLYTKEQKQIPLFNWRKKADE